MDVKFMGVAVIVASIYGGVLYFSRVWLKHYFVCLVVGFFLGFSVVFVPNIGFDHYDSVEKIFFGGIVGVLLAQLTHVLIRYIFEKR